MMVLKPFAGDSLAKRSTPTRTGRKIALCGSHLDSLRDAPWDDPSWEFWGHACSRHYYRHEMDRYFDLHPKACWIRAGKTAQYPVWLGRNMVPIYMQKKYGEVPASVEFPKGRILAEFSDCRPYFTNQVAWMIALAMTEGVSAIGLFGVNYGIESEYLRQRGSCEFWLGRAVERGIRIVLPAQSSLLADPLPLYGYDSHDEVTGKLKPEYAVKTFKPGETITALEPGQTFKRAEPPADVRKLIAQEEEDFPRPEWALGPLPEKPNGKAEEMHS